MFDRPPHTALAALSHVGRGAERAQFRSSRPRAPIGIPPVARQRNMGAEWLPNDQEERRVIEVGLLGSVTVNVDGAPAELSGILEKALLARLSLAPGQDVSQGRLIDDLWGENPPGNAIGSLHTLVYRLRKALGPAGSSICRTDRGYKLDVPLHCVDATKFRVLADRSRLGQGSGDSSRATLLRDALELWRGPALAGLDRVPFVLPRRTALEAARLCALAERFEADLAAGAGAELVAELEALVTEHPFDEKLWGHLMVALYRSGSQAAALRCYERVRTLLADELGIPPSPALAALERAILMQEPSLLTGDVTSGKVGSAPDGGPSSRARVVVTIVATDLEGRARLWSDSPAEMVAAIKRYDELLIAAVLAHGGRVLSRADGSSFSVFVHPSDALGSVLELQRSVSAHAWGTAGPLPVTAAVHTGEAEVVDGSIFGPVLHHASRLAQAAYGGQVVVSATTAELARDGLPAGCELLDLGHWSLSDVPRPLHAYELRHRELGRAVRALRAGRPGTGTLPMPSTSFVGREVELVELIRLVDEAPIVTLTGVGGVGKTRLAVHFGAIEGGRFSGGTWFCDLSVVTTGDEVVERLAAALGLRAASTLELRRDLSDWLTFSKALLIVDNCEHVVAKVAAELGPMLGEGGSAKVVFTSRRALRLPGEHVMRVHPLARLARSAGSQAQGPRVALLLDRARAAGALVDVQDPALREIVDRLDGLPLAIELAARRLTAMTPAELEVRLSRSFDLLEAADGSRQRQALRATIDWSFGLLSPTSRLLFAALSMCEGGFGLELAEALGAALGLHEGAVADAIADLWDQSLIGTEGSVPGRARYRMLALISEYSSRRLDVDGNRAKVAEAHAVYFASLAARLSKCPYGPLEPGNVATVDLEFDNIRAAYAWCVAEGKWDLGMHLLDSVVPEFVLRERIEIGRWATETLATLGENTHALRAVALAVSANMALVEGRLTEAESLSRRSLELEARLGAPITWLSRNVLALACAGSSQFEEAEEFLEELVRITEVSGDPMPHAVACFDRALVASFSTDPAGGLPWAQELVALGDRWRSASLRAMGLVSTGRALSAQDPARARTALVEAVTLAEASHSGLLADQAKRVLSEIHAARGGHRAGLVTLGELLLGFGRSGDLSQQLQTVVSTLDPLIAVGAFEVATLLCGALGQTALGSVAQCERALEASRTRLSHDAYRTAFGRGADLSPTGLMRVAGAEIERLTDQA
jgi:predicted ATPase/DNA-binding SARP family transcriptional activator